jgi:hypothetical protein
MTPLLLVTAGVIAASGGVALLLSFGSRFRVGRLLAATPLVSVDEAIRIAQGDSPRYVRVDGRLDSADDFPDEHERPLVYRRRRLQLRRSSRWQSLDEQVEAVPFEIREGLSAIAIDHAALAHGLVVLPRESLGTAGEIPDRVPAGTPPAVPARLRVEQVSSIEHAVVLGVPVRVDGGVRISAGLGRPLILTTLEVPEAIRILGEGRGRPLAVVLLVAGGMGAAVIGLAWAVITALR